MPLNLICLFIKYPLLAAM